MENPAHVVMREWSCGTTEYICMCNDTHAMLYAPMKDIHHGAYII